MATRTTLNIDSLPEYIEQHRDELFVKSAVGSKTLDYVELMLNVKHKDALNYLDSDVEFQAANCGWNPTGSDTFSQRYIEVKPVEIEKEICYLSFREKYMNYQLNFEAGRETLPFEEKFVESNMNAIKDALEDLVWQGNDTVGINGFLKDINDLGAFINISNGSTATEAIDALVASLDSRMLKKGVNIFVSPTLFRNYIMESNSGCCANRPVIDAASEQITYFGDSRITIIPVAGLEANVFGEGQLVAATKDALVYGTDIEGSESVYRLWFDEKEQKFLFRVLFNAGTAVKYPDEVKMGIITK